MLERPLDLNGAADDVSCSCQTTFSQRESDTMRKGVAAT